MAFIQGIHLGSKAVIYVMGVCRLQLSSGSEGAKELGVSIYIPYDNGEPRSYLQFPNHLMDSYHDTIVYSV